MHKQLLTKNLKAKMNISPKTEEKTRNIQECYIKMNCMVTNVSNIYNDYGYNCHKVNM